MKLISWFTPKHSTRSALEKVYFKPMATEVGQGNPASPEIKTNPN